MPRWLASSFGCRRNPKRGSHDPKAPWKAHTVQVHDTWPGDVHGLYWPRPAADVDVLGPTYCSKVIVSVSGLSVGESAEDVTVKRACRSMWSRWATSLAWLLLPVGSLLNEEASGIDVVALRPTQRRSDRSSRALTNRKAAHAHESLCCNTSARGHPRLPPALGQYKP